MVGSRLILTWTDKKSGETKYARFDVVTTETLEAVMAITSNPVEEGSDVTDHSREDTKRVTIEGYVSNAPLLSNPDAVKYIEFKTIDLVLPKQPSPLSPSPGGLTRSVTGFVDNLLNPPPNKAVVLKAKGDMPDRAKLMYELLDKARTDKVLIKCSTRLAEVDDLMIERLAVPRTVEGGTGANFQLDLKKVRIVKSSVVAAPVSIEARGAPGKDSGSKAAKKTDDKANEQLKSALKSTFDGGAGLAGALKKGLTGGL